MGHIYHLQFATLDTFGWLLTVLAMVCSYLTGSIPFGVLVARSKGVDIQQVGSGNIGATNVGRALGRRWGFFVFGLDFLKGFAPTLAARLFGPRLGDEPFVVYDLPVLCASAAVLGHVFSVWLGFRGGKAGATGLGVGVVLCWPATLVAAVVWLLVWATTRYISLATMLGGVAYVVAYVVVAFCEGTPWDRGHHTLSVFCFAVSVLIIVRHRDNIRRLREGTEAKV